MRVVRTFADPKTVSKAVLISGDVSPGSKNDYLMRHYIGEDWRAQVGYGQAKPRPYPPGSRLPCSPGYDHARLWPKVVELAESLKK